MQTKVLRRSSRLTAASSAASAVNVPTKPAGAVVDHPSAGAAEPKAKRLKKAPEGISRYYEEVAWNKGFKSVAGIDEAGRGPLAGPVVAAACIVAPGVELSIPGVNDSKKLTAAERELLYEQIISHPSVTWAVTAVDEDTIDSINILQATMQAMELAVAGLATTPDYLLVDGNRLPKAFDPETSEAITKGDTKVYAIAAASIIAKVTRDRMMLELHEKWPEYQFKDHMGYGVPKHVEAIRDHGPCPAHRRSFNPVKTWYPVPEAKKVEDEEEDMKTVKKKKKKVVKKNEAKKSKIN